MRKRNTGGNPQVSLYIHLLTLIINGCEKRNPDGSEDELTRVHDKAKNAHDRLSAARLRKLAAIAELKNATWDLDEAFFECKARAEECMGTLRGRHGLASSDLADYGIRPKRPRARRSSTASGPTPEG
jgi:hypothetical protein